MSEQNTSDYQPSSPPDFQPPPIDQPSGPQMSVGETLTGIFFEPGKTFESLRARPRFLIAAVIMTVALLAYTALLIQRVGFENFARAAVESSPGAAQMTAEQKEQQVKIQSNPFVKALNYVSPLIGMAVFIAAGGGLYLLGAMLMGGRTSYKQALAVWTYSSYPPTVLTMLLNIILLFIKSPDSYDPVHALRRGLVQANLGLLVDPKASPVLATVLGSFDVFSFYGLFLAAIGLRLVGKLSSGSAWGVVLIIWLIGLVLRLGFSLMFGSAL